MTSTPHDPFTTPSPAPARPRTSFTAYPYPVPRPRPHRWYDHETGTVPPADLGGAQRPQPDDAAHRSSARTGRPSHLELIVRS